MPNELDEDFNSDEGDVTSPHQPEKRDIVLKVRVNAEEKSKIYRQKGRLSCSAFLRDRGLNPHGFYDPTYSAIGSVYLATGILRKSKGELAQAGQKLQATCEQIRSLLHNGLDPQRLECLLEKLEDDAQNIFGAGKRIERQGDEIIGRAQALGQIHMQELLERHPGHNLKPRRKP